MEVSSFRPIVYRKLGVHSRTEAARVLLAYE